MKDDDQNHPRVGYCQPPKEHQFQPGVSGNPNGRRRYRTVKTKCDDSPSQTVKRILSTKFDTKINGKMRKITYSEAILRTLVKKAADGDIRATDKIFRIAKEEPAKLDREKPTEFEREMLKRYVARNSSQEDDGSDDDLNS